MQRENTMMHHLYNISVLPVALQQSGPYAFTVSLTLMWDGNQLMWSHTVPTHSALIPSWGEPYKLIRR